MNKVILIGRLTKDPELNLAQGNGTAVCRFSLAVTRPFKKDETDFINCIAFGKTGETISQYMTKGRQLAVTGNIRTGSYDAKDGTKRYTTDVIVESFEFIGSNQNNNASSNQSGGFSNSGNGLGDNFEEDMTPVDDGDMPF
ncbi:single-stranded DNA-binding protein [Clostridium tertium]|uniref:single-stranded DNA-binding protein n=1 Tax=Clostridium tertium TaxID=1559 RepID=UPI0024B3A304|nr:single-stranded DNA-binding protein [Clostridium tertium]MDI9215974.1 single-stranded DNA-binding protein [Clostridium tertium]